MIQGIGFGLAEVQVLDPATGICVNLTLVDYKLLTIKDMPEIHVIVEPVDPSGSFGAKGLVEPPYSIPAPVIAKAVAKAIGKRFQEIPIIFAPSFKNSKPEEKKGANDATL